VVIADQCAYFVNQIFNSPESHNGSTLVLGAILFAFQIYGDFSGYSDIAIGVAKLFGFHLKQNFAFPYFSRDIAEFWRRWHISLSTWFRDYLYIPLGGSRGNLVMKIRNTLLIFIISGFWHGANWTFIIWGLLNALYFLPLLILQKNRKNIEIIAKGKTLPNLKDFAGLLLTFGLVILGWIFFRSDNIHHAFNYLEGIISYSIFSYPQITPWIFLLIILFIIVEWLGREGKYAIENIFSNRPRYYRWGFYYLIVCLIFLFSGEKQEFIYFQF
jgi:D-alanyl-lipoteichoic acid acyltransferase DltB (MBOAT superfamily)